MAKKKPQKTKKKSEGLTKEERIEDFRTQSIVFNRKIISEKNLREILETINKENMISGGALNIIATDLLKLRTVLEVMYKCYKEGNIEQVHNAVEVLGQIL